MKIEGNICTIDACMDNEALSIHFEKIRLELGSVTQIVVDMDQGVASSALFSLLFAIKKEHPKLQIDLLEHKNIEIQEQGILTLTLG